MSTYRIFILTITLSLATLVQATPDVDISGFATLGGMYKDNDDLGFSRNFTIEGEKEHFSVTGDSLVGLQINATLNESWEAVVQGIYQDKASNNIEDYVEWAFLRYQASRNIAFRLGRTSTDLYLLSEYTPVGYAYTWARPPTEYYSHLGSFSYIDGVDVSYSNNIHDRFLDLRLGYGSSTVKIEAQNGEPLEFKLNDTLSMSGLYSTNFWKIKLAAAFTKPSGFNNEGQQLLINSLNSIPSALWPQAASLAEQFAFSDKEIRYYAAGYEIEIDQVTLTTEFAYTDPNWETYPDYASGYLSLAYRLNEVTLFGVYSKVKNTDDKISVTAPTSNPLLPEATQTQLEQLWQGANYNINYRTIDQDTISVGVRWDLYSQLALKVQYDYTQIGENGSFLWASDEPITTKTTVNIFSINASVVF